MNGLCSICGHEVDAHDDLFLEMKKRNNIHCVKHLKGCHTIISLPLPMPEDYPNWAECNCRKVYR
jgi:hypothetical protein